MSNITEELKDLGIAEGTPHLKEAQESKPMEYEIGSNTLENGKHEFTGNNTTPLIDLVASSNAKQEDMEKKVTQDQEVKELFHPEEVVPMEGANKGNLYHKYKELLQQDRNVLFGSANNSKHNPEDQNSIQPKEDALFKNFDSEKTHDFGKTFSEQNGRQETPGAASTDLLSFQTELTDGLKKKEEHEFKLDSQLEVDELIEGSCENTFDFKGELGSNSLYPEETLLTAGVDNVDLCFKDQETKLPSLGVPFERVENLDKKEDIFQQEQDGLLEEKNIAPVDLLDFQLEPTVETNSKGEHATESKLQSEEFKLAEGGSENVLDFNSQIGVGSNLHWNSLLEEETDKVKPCFNREEENSPNEFVLSQETEGVEQDPNNENTLKPEKFALSESKDEVEQNYKSIETFEPQEVTLLENAEEKQEGEDSLSEEITVTEGAAEIDSSHKDENHHHFEHSESDERADTLELGHAGQADFQVDELITSQSADDLELDQKNFETLHHQEAILPETTDKLEQDLNGEEANQPKQVLFSEEVEVIPTDLIGPQVEPLAEENEEQEQVARLNIHQENGNQTKATSDNLPSFKEELTSENQKEYLKLVSDEGNSEKLEVSEANQPDAGLQASDLIGDFTPDEVSVPAVSFTSKGEDESLPNSTYQLGEVLPAEEADKLETVNKHEETIQPSEDTLPESVDVVGKHHEAREAPQYEQEPLSKEIDVTLVDPLDSQVEPTVENNTDVEHITEANSQLYGSKQTEKLSESQPENENDLAPESQNEVVPSSLDQVTLENFEVVDVAQPGAEVHTSGLPSESTSDDAPVSTVNTESKEEEGVATKVTDQPEEIFEVVDTELAKSLELAEAEDASTNGNQGQAEPKETTTLGEAVKPKVSKIGSDTNGAASRLAAKPKGADSAIKKPSATPTRTPLTRGLKSTSADKVNGVKAPADKIPVPAIKPRVPLASRTATAPRTDSKLPSTTATRSTSSKPALGSKSAGTTTTSTRTSSLPPRQPLTKSTSSKPVPAKATPPIGSSLARSTSTPKQPTTTPARLVRKTESTLAKPAATTTPTRLVRKTDSLTKSNPPNGSTAPTATKVSRTTSATQPKPTTPTNATKPKTTVPKPFSFMARTPSKPKEVKESNLK